MQIRKEQIENFNQQRLRTHQENWDFFQNQLVKRGLDCSAILKQIQNLQIAIPSWALGAGGTRFGRFSFGGEPCNLEQKIDDVGLLHALTQSAGAISLHIPWDIPKDELAIKQQAAELGILFDAVNSNTFQDQDKQKHSYKFGSLCHTNRAVRQQAIEHNIEVIKYGEAIGSKSLTIWLADGTSFPGQHNFRKAFQNTQDSLKEIYQHMPSDWKMFIEYKPFEPNFYSMVIPDWGTSLMLAEGCGEKAYTLIDLGHHLPNTNIEQIVSILMMKGKLGGFHFNDSKYSDDDLTCGAIKPYQLFLIFNELVDGMENNEAANPTLAWMIDASHNLKDPLEDLMQSLEAIREAFAKALLVDRAALSIAQMENDVAQCQEIIQQAYRTDVRPLLVEARRLSGGAIDPIEFFRQHAVRKQLIRDRGENVVATGL
ncbi:TIM barrel protein [Kordia sp.]|jgi:L-rhamnose isomerase/sugar isomerase|uniref:TIM barrel protein n=1 Tax=Kordia sp. TaxID=1965332 RepID=UPI0025B92008|nr:TIM barrel protein [Kordia sp.]MCH2083142.1 TIM barrel protein [Saprospiraceae bacterium]MCH2193319.1 TIM barrel protein [Kordia sp.]